MLYLHAPLPNDAIGTFSYDIDTNTWTWSRELYQRRGLDPTEAEPTLDLLMVGVLEDDRPGLHKSTGGNRPVFRIQHGWPRRTGLDATHRGWLIIIPRALLLGRSGGLRGGGECKHGQEDRGTESDLVSLNYHALGFGRLSERMAPC